MSRAREWDFQVGRVGGGLTLYPYQFALGVSFQYWHCIFAPAFRIHVGPLKIWAHVALK